jgi:hypothetical protein
VIVLMLQPRCNSSRALVRMQHDGVRRSGAFTVLPVSVLTKDRGIEACVDAITAHTDWLTPHTQYCTPQLSTAVGELQRAGAGQFVVEQMMQQPVWQQALRAMHTPASVDEWSQRVMQEFVRLQR